VLPGGGRLAGLRTTAAEHRGADHAALILARRYDIEIILYDIEILRRAPPIYAVKQRQTMKEDSGGCCRDIVSSDTVY
jgi:hypothetical protein